MASALVNPQAPQSDSQHERDLTRIRTALAWRKGFRTLEAAVAHFGKRRWNEICHQDTVATRSNVIAFPSKSASSNKRFDGLFETHEKLVLSVCQRITKNLTLAQDAAQETWVRVDRELRRGEQPKDEQDWLATIARTATLDFVAKEGTHSGAEYRVEMFNAEGAPSKAITQKERADYWIKERSRCEPDPVLLSQIQMFPREATALALDCKGWDDLSIAYELDLISARDLSEAGEAGDRRREAARSQAKRLKQNARAIVEALGPRRHQAVMEAITRAYAMVDLGIETCKWVRNADSRYSLSSHVGGVVNRLELENVVNRWRDAAGFSPDRAHNPVKIRLTKIEDALRQVPPELEYPESPRAIRRAAGSSGYADGQIKLWVLRAFAKEERLRAWLDSFWWSARKPLKPSLARSLPLPTSRLANWKFPARQISKPAKSHPAMLVYSPALHEDVEKRETELPWMTQAMAALIWPDNPEAQARATGQIKS